MNVDVQNFHQVREYIRDKELIKKSEFISFDLEFTGVKFQNHERERWDMFLNEKYQKMSAVATNFNIIQIGITFVLPSSNNKHVAYPFNFYVFPRQNFMNDPVISMQAGCVKFNTSQNMDWNRWIRKGINFVKVIQANKFLNNDKSKTFKELYDYLSIDNQQILDDILLELKEKESGSERKFQLPRLSAFQVKKVLDRYSDENNLNYLISLPKENPEDDKISQITVKILSSAEHSSNEASKIESLIGFTLIFEEIWLSGKSFIGHNCLYDLLFIYESFIDSLPSDYHNFKKLVADDDRKFYDTKYIASRIQENGKVFPKGTSLEQMYNYFSGIVTEEKLILAEGFQKYDLKNPTLHEAGFDSFLTAWIFLNFPTECLYEGKICSAKSFYTLNLRKSSDQIRKDIAVFVVPVAVYNAFIPLDELKRMKIEYTKNIREQLMKQGILNLMAVSEGLKQIFVATKDSSGIPMSCKVLNQLKNDKKIPNVLSMQSWILTRNEAQISRNKINQKNTSM